MIFLPTIVPTAIARPSRSNNDCTLRRKASSSPQAWSRKAGHSSGGNAATASKDFISLFPLLRRHQSFQFSVRERATIAPGANPVAPSATTPSAPQQSLLPSDRRSSAFLLSQLVAVAAPSIGSELHPGR